MEKYLIETTAKVKAFSSKQQQIVECIIKYTLLEDRQLSYITLPRVKTKGFIFGRNVNRCFV